MDAGEKWRPFYFSGYRGEQCGSAAFGVRFDSQIVRLSGVVAREFWTQAYSLSTNVTRLDVMATVFPSDGNHKRLGAHHRQLRRRKKRRGRPPKFKFWYGPDGPEAFVVGRRVSDSFGRCYDKGIESRLPEYRGTLRYEAELKRALATQWAKQLDHSNSEASDAAKMVHAFFSVRASRLPSWPIPREWDQVDGESSGFVNMTIQKTVNRDGNRNDAGALVLGQGVMRRRALWLANAVRPTIQMFLEQGRADVILESLGVEVNNGTIEKSIDDRWSNFSKER
jgi:hypothetical protein